MLDNRPLKNILSICAKEIFIFISLLLEQVLQVLIIVITELNSFNISKALVIYCQVAVQKV